MGAAKVTLNSRVIMDITDSTVTANNLLQGVIAYGADGEKITGAYVPSGSPTLQSKTADPSTSQQIITADSGYDGLSSVTISAMPSGSAKTPTTTITANPSISVNSSGLITASVSGSQSITPTVTSGYVSAGTSGTVSVSGSNTQQLTTQGAQTITPSTTNQTIASGRYLTGTQTIAGDANLVSSNIISGVSIFGVAGNVSFVTYYTGSTDPASSLGNNGDIYLKVVS